MQLGGKVGKAATTGAGDKRHGEVRDLQGEDKRRELRAPYGMRVRVREAVGSVLKSEEWEAGIQGEALIGKNRKKETCFKGLFDEALRQGA